MVKVGVLWYMGCIILLTRRAWGFSFSVPLNGFTQSNSSVALRFDAQLQEDEGCIILAPSSSSSNDRYTKGWVYSTTSAPFSNTSFSTYFVFQMVTLEIKPADGVAFFISSLRDHEPDPTAGAYLGLTSSSTDGNTSNHLFAVEFDSFPNSEVNDPDSDHIGIDVNTVKSVKVFNLNGTFAYLNFTKNTTFAAWIDYTNSSKNLEVRLATNSSAKPVNPLLTHTIDLEQIISASTGIFQAEHRLCAWNFSAPGMVNNPKSDIKAGARTRKRKAIVIAVPILGTSLLLYFIAYVCCLLKRKNNERIPLCLPSLQSPMAYFNYQELKIATGGFSQAQIIGSGGFGRVYKGKLKDGSMVAVKVLSSNSKQGTAELLSELSIIGQIKHQFLLRVRGWCYDRTHLMIVYDYMPNGSLDKVLFEEDEANILTWEQRFRVVKGVAEALAFLHDEGERSVVHRDVKASNILLDKDMLPKLGDFGLAKLIEKDGIARTMTRAGTMGYIAPELAYTGRANEKTDVYSFGILALEIVCGRRVIDEQFDASLLEWIWALHEDGRLFDAVDWRLKGNWVKDETMLVLVLGLLCCHADAQKRPCMRDYCLILEGNLPLPLVPLKRPRFIVNGDEKSGPTIASLLSSTTQN